MRERLSRNEDATSMCVYSLEGWVVELVGILKTKGVGEPGEGIYLGVFVLVGQEGSWGGKCNFYWN